MADQRLLWSMVIYSWIGLSTQNCDPIQPPVPLGGNFAIHTYSKTSILSYVCYDGYVLVGQNEFLCQDGLWNAGDPIVPPKCTLDITKNEFIPVILSEGTTGTKAVDERQSAQHGGQFCAQTRGSNPWVTLDLGQRARMVLQIRIALAEDEPMVSNMEIRFGNDSEHWKNPLCDWLDAKRVESSKGTVLDVEPCQHGGRFLSLASVNSLVPISLCDIQILVGPLEVLSKQLCPHNTGGITTKMGSCLHFNLKARMSFQEAVEYCQAKGLHLLRNEDLDIYAWMMEHFQSVSKGPKSRALIWVGAKRLANSSHWSWIDGDRITGTSLVSLDWGISEPSGEDCVVIDSALGWKWNSVRCVISAHVMCHGFPKHCPPPDLDLYETLTSDPREVYQSGDEILTTKQNETVARSCQDSGSWTPRKKWLHLATPLKLPPLTLDPANVPTIQPEDEAESEAIKIAQIPDSTPNPGNAQTLLDYSYSWGILGGTAFYWAIFFPHNYAI